MDHEQDTRTLEQDIFGGSDSELSESDEEVQQQAPVRRKQAPAAAQGEPEPEPSSDDEDYKKEPAPKRRRTKRNEDASTTRRKPSKPKRKASPVEVDYDGMTPEEEKKARLNAQLDAILKPKKVSRPKKRKKDAEEEVLDRFADEEVSRLREVMLKAAEEDNESNRDKLPATAKLKLLPQVMEVLRKASLAQSIVDNNLLEGVRRWLEPLPDGSLPTLNIQRDFFPVLKRMEYIDSSVLKESGLGRVVLFYTKCKRVTADIARIANDLVAIWSRPIVKRSASYRDRVVPISQEMGAEVDTVRPSERLNAILARARDETKGRAKKNAVMIPQRELGNYTIAPKTNTGVMRQNASVDIDIERRKKNADRLRSLTRKIAAKARE